MKHAGNALKALVDALVDALVEALAREIRPVDFPYRTQPRRRLGAGKAACRHVGTGESQEADTVE